MEAAADVAEKLNNATIADGVEAAPAADAVPAAETKKQGKVEKGKKASKAPADAAAGSSGPSDEIKEYFKKRIAMFEAIQKEQADIRQKEGGAPIK